MNRPAVPFKDLERQLLDLFVRVLFDPILRVLRKETPAQIEIRNAADPLAEALRSGRIQLTDGVFSGRLSAAISGALRKIGATFDAREKVYRMPAARVPTWVVAEASAFTSRAQAVHKQVVRELDQVQSKLEVSLYERPIEFSETVAKVEDGWRSTAESLEIKPDIGPGAVDAMRRTWAETTKLPIRTFAQGEVEALRKAVEKNATEGYRIDRLAEAIEGRYDVTKNKAKFLARNETSIFMSKFREERFKEAGVRRYRWSTSNDARVRPALNLSPAQKAHAGNHRRLNGKVFFFDSPPIVDENTGRRANPGEDYNCRCVAIPILDRGAPHHEVANQGPAHVLLVRHGSTELNEEDRLRGWLDVPLSEKGFAEAREAGRKVRSLGVDVIYSSDLLRARQTATQIEFGARAPVFAMRDLRPINFGDLQGRKIVDVLPDMIRLMSAWEEDPSVRAPGGGTFAEFQAANESVAREVLSSCEAGKRVAVVSHLRNCAWFLAYVENDCRPLAGREVALMDEERNQPDVGDVVILNYDPKTRKLSHRKTS